MSKTKNIIDDLKANEKPFGLMSEEMQEKAREIQGVKKDPPIFEAYTNPPHGWLGCHIALFADETTYRLRPDYAEEPEIEECEIQREIFTPLECGRFVITKSNHQRILLSEVCNEPDFIGFKFEDGQVANGPLVYSSKTNKYDFVHISQIKNGHFTVLHATHVLFRRQT